MKKSYKVCLDCSDTGATCEKVVENAVDFKVENGLVIFEDKNFEAVAAYPVHQVRSIETSK